MEKAKKWKEKAVIWMKQLTEEGLSIEQRELEVCKKKKRLKASAGSDRKTAGLTIVKCVHTSMLTASCCKIHLAIF